MVPLSELKGRVLVAEDDAALRGLIAEYLRFRGCDVDEASTVREVRSAVSTSSKYDVVISDIHLPDGDVTDALDHDQADVPVVLITGDASTRLTSAAIAADPAGLLLKPFEFTELHAVVAHALRHHTRIPSSGDPAGPVRLGPVPIMVRPQADHDRRTPMRTLLRTGVVVAAIVVFAFLLGQLLMNDDVTPGGVVAPAPASDSRVIVVPVAVPAQPADAEPRR